MKYAASLLLLFISVLALGQTAEIDSLCKVLTSEKTDTSRVKTLNLLSRCYGQLSDLKHADSCARQAFTLAQQLNYKKGEGIALVVIAKVCYELGDYTNAKANATRALKVDSEITDKLGMASAHVCMGNVLEAEGNPDEALGNFVQSARLDSEAGNKTAMSNSLLNAGNIYEDRGNFPVALTYYLEALRIDSETSDKHNMGNSYGNIGNIYLEEGNYNEALKNHLLSLKLDSEIGYKRGIAIADINISNTYYGMHNYSEALNYLFRGARVEEEIDDKENLSSAYLNIGNVYFVLKDYGKAMDNYLKSMGIIETLGDKRIMGYDYQTLARINILTGKYAIARQYIDSALNVGKALNDKHIIRETYHTRAQYDSATGNYKAAYDDYKNFIVFRDSMTNEENTKKLVSEQMQYDFDKKEARQKADQDKKDAVTTADKKRQTIIIGFVSAGLLVVIIFSILLFSRFKITQRQKVLIEKQKLVVEEQKQIVEHQKVVVEEKNKDILDSITYAKRLQDAILPPLSVIKKYLPESFVLYKPKDIVAGDFYWMERVDDIVLIAACDCTGHGVPGALVSVVCSNALNRALNEFKLRDTGKMLDKVRELVLETFVKSEGEVKDGMDCSFCAINTKTNQVEWSGAYNPLWYIQNGELKEVVADKQPIGKSDNPVSFSAHTLKLAKGDSLYLFTDGYADQFGGPKGKKFKYKQLQQLITDNAKLAMEAQGKMLNETIEAWKGNLEQVDDVLIIGIRV